MTLIQALPVISLITLVFVLHVYILTPKERKIETDVMIDSRLIAANDEDLTDPKKIAGLVYKSIAVDLSKKVERLEIDVTHLVNFRNVFGFYVAGTGLVLGLISFYLQLNP